MLPVIAKEKLADYIDVFCEKGFFNPEETETILRAGLQYGLKPKLHVNQLNSIGGIETGIKMNALSMDHLESMPEEEIERIKNSGWKGILYTVANCGFFSSYTFSACTQIVGFRVCALALASDYNPGSSPSGNMNMVIALACIQMKLLPEEAVNAATVNGAFAMGSGKYLRIRSLKENWPTSSSQNPFLHWPIFHIPLDQILSIK